MPSPFAYDLPTVGKIDGLVIKDFFCDFRSKHFIDKDYYGEVQLAYRCWSDKVLTIKKGPDDMEKFRDILWQSNIEHKSEQFRNERKVITHEVFKVVCDFRVQGKIEGDHETGKHEDRHQERRRLLRSTSSTSWPLRDERPGGRGIREVLHRPAQPVGGDREALGAEPAPRPTIAPKPKPKVEPQYVVHEAAPAPEPRPEEEARPASARSSHSSRRT